MNLIAPFDLSLEEFLRGPDSSEDLDVDRIFSVPFDRLMRENAPYAESALDYDAASERTPSMVVPGAMFVGVAAGVILLDPRGKAIGCYVWSSLALDADWQGLGLGRELVIERSLREEANPVWALDTPSYSPAGVAAHAAAWRYARGHPAEIKARALAL